MIENIANIMFLMRLPFLFNIAYTKYDNDNEQYIAREFSFFVKSFNLVNDELIGEATALSKNKEIADRAADTKMPYIKYSNHF